MLRIVQLYCVLFCLGYMSQDDVIKWKHFPRYLPIVRGIHRSPGNSPHKGQWHRALMFSLICAWTNNRDAGDFRRHHANHDVNVMYVCPLAGIDLEHTKTKHSLAWTTRTSTLLATLEVVKMTTVKITTSGATDDWDFVNMTTFSL